MKWLSVERRDWVLVLASTGGGIVKQAKPESKCNETMQPARRNIVNELYLINYFKLRCLFPFRSGGEEYFTAK